MVRPGGNQFELVQKRKNFSPGNSVAPSALLRVRLIISRSSAPPNGLGKRLAFGLQCADTNSKRYKSLVISPELVSDGDVRQAMGSLG